jgi:hypothetical protein
VGADARRRAAYSSSSSDPSFSSAAASCAEHDLGPIDNAPGLADITAAMWGLSRGGGGRRVETVAEDTSDKLDRVSTGSTISAQAPSYRECLLARGGGRLTHTAHEDTFDAL